METIAIKKPRVALVLGSGGLKCAASLGVWKVLQEAGIEIDMAVGCSGGSLYAACIASGLGLQETTALTQQLWTPQVASRYDFRAILQALFPQLFGFKEQFGLIDDRLIWQRIYETFGEATFADTQIPAFLAATDLNSGEAVTLSEGRLADAMRASIAIPFALRPWRVNGRLLTDGGVTNPMPVDIAIRENAEVIVAVGFVNSPPSGFDSVLQYAVHTTEILCHNLHMANFAFHNMVHHTEIVPLMVNFEEDIWLTDTHKIPQIIEAGEREARKQLPYLRRLLKERHLA